LAICAFAIAIGVMGTNDDAWFAGDDGDVRVFALVGRNGDMTDVFARNDDALDTRSDESCDGSNADTDSTAFAVVDGAGDCNRSLFAGVVSLRGCNEE
jgi:hypothetical protein